MLPNAPRAVMWGWLGRGEHLSSSLSSSSCACPASWVLFWCWRLGPNPSRQGGTLRCISHVLNRCFNHWDIAEGEGGGCLWEERPLFVSGKKVLGQNPAAVSRPPEWWTLPEKTYWFLWALTVLVFSPFSTSWLTWVFIYASPSGSYFGSGCLLRWPVEADPTPLTPSS